MASMEPTPDLRFYLAIHATLRSDIARYVRAVERATEDERSRRVALRRWAGGFLMMTVGAVLVWATIALGG